jgi:hypothetical protein
MLNWLLVRYSAAATQTAHRADAQRLRGRLFTLAVVMVAASTSPRDARSQAAPADLFRERLVDMYRSIALGDTATLRLRLADSLVWIVGATGAGVSKAQLLAAAGTVQIPSPRFDVDSVTTHAIGELVAVEYVRSDHRRAGTTDFVTRWRASAIFAPYRGGSQLAHHTLSWLVAPVVPIVLDSVALEAFIGRYQIAPGYIDDVHWERGSLVATASGQSVGARLVPVSPNGFSPDGIGALIVFERDGAGRVTGYVQGYPDGHVVKASRLP